MVFYWLVLVAVLVQVHCRAKYNLHDDDYANSDTFDPFVRSKYDTTDFNTDAIDDYKRYPNPYKNEENINDEDVIRSFDIPVRGTEKPLTLVVFEKIIALKPGNKPECYISESEVIKGSTKIECDGLSSSTVGKLTKYLFRGKHRKNARSGAEPKPESKLEDLLKNVLNLGSGVVAGQVPDSAKGSKINAHGDIHTSSSSRGNTSIGVGDLQANAGFEDNHQSHASGGTQNGSYHGTSSLKGNSNYYANKNVGNPLNNDRLNPGLYSGPNQGSGKKYNSHFGNRNPLNNLVPSNNGANYKDVGYRYNGENNDNNRPYYNGQNYNDLGPTHKGSPFNNVRPFNNGGSFNNFNLPNNATLYNRNLNNNPLNNFNPYENLNHKNNLKPSNNLYPSNNLNPANSLNPSDYFYPSNKLYPVNNLNPANNFSPANNVYHSNNLYPQQNLNPANNFNHLYNGNPLHNANPYDNPYNNLSPYNQYGSLNNGKVFFPNNVVPFNYNDVGLQVKGHQNYVDPKSYVNSNLQLGVHSHTEQIARHPYALANANSNPAIFNNPATNAVVTVLPHRRGLRENDEERSIDSDSEFQTQRGSYEIDLNRQEPAHELS